jgi:hypothetical protein
MPDRLDVSRVLWSGADVTGWRAPDRPGLERFVAHPDREHVRQLLPLRPGTIVAIGTRSSDDRPRRRAARDSFGAAALIMLGAVSTRRRLGVVGADSLVDHVAKAIGRTGLLGIVQCGPPRANQKPVLQLHDRWGRTVAWVKVAWNDLTRQLLETEVATLERLAGVGDKQFTAPAVLAGGAFGESTWVALAPIGVTKRVRPTMAEADALALRVERTADRWEGACSGSAYLARLAASAAGLDRGEPLVARLAERWGERPLQCAASHGDFVPWNILSGSPAPAVWDWERYSTSAPVGTDRFHFRTQVGIHRRGREVSEVVAEIASDLAAVVPELEPWQRQAHLEWYVVDLLCRYEGDGVDQYQSHWSGLTSGLARAATELLKEHPL